MKIGGQGVYLSKSEAYLQEPASAIPITRLIMLADLSTCDLHVERLS